jgi:hypothetical protein
MEPNSRGVLDTPLSRGKTTQRLGVVTPLSIVHIVIAAAATLGSRQGRPGFRHHNERSPPA